MTDIGKINIDGVVIITTKNAKTDEPQNDAKFIN